MRVRQIRKERHLAEEPFSAQSDRDLGVQDFDGNLSVRMALAREINMAHPPALELTLEPVSLGQYLLKVVKPVWHVPAPRKDGD